MAKDVETRSGRDLRQGRPDERGRRPRLHRRAEGARAATRRTSTDDGGREALSRHAAPGAVRTTCPYCGVGCGVLATPDGKGGAAIKGDPDHPANAGRLCSKGSALGETLGLETRLLHPMVDGRRSRAGPTRSTTSHAVLQPSGRARAGGDRLLSLRPASDRGLLRRQQAGERLHRHAARRYQLAAVHGLLGRRPSPRLRRRRGAAMLRRPGAGRSRGAGRLQRRLVPPGALPAHPDGAGRARHARRQHRSAPHRHLRGRRPASADQARHRRRLFGGLLVARPTPAPSTRRSSTPYAGLRRACAARPLAPTWRRRRGSGLDAPDVARSTTGSPATPRVVSCYSQGVNQSAQGTDKVNAIINCHLATGRIGKPGSGPLSLTGQPNAMGGREVGGLANMLAAHMGFSDAERDRVRRFWDAPNLVAARASRPSTCSRRSPTDVSRRCG